MTAAKKVDYGATFDFLANAIDWTKRDMTTEYLTQINTAKRFLGKVARGLDALSSNETVPVESNGRGYISREDLVEILNLYYKPVKSLEEQAGELAKYLKTRIPLLKKLRVNPEEVYKHIPSRIRLLTVFEKFRDFYKAKQRVLEERAKKAIEDEMFRDYRDGNAD